MRYSNSAKQAMDLQKRLSALTEDNQKFYDAWAPRQDDLRLSLTDMLDYNSSFFC